MTDKPASHHGDDDEDGSELDLGPPHVGPRRQASVGQTWIRWSPVAAGALRAAAGLVMFSASLLTLPMTTVTPMLTGVALVMLVGGVAAVVKSCRDDPALSSFGRWFSLSIAALAAVAIIVVLVKGPGAYGPKFHSPGAPMPQDGSIRFSP
jgi:hypothetical protein